MEKHGGSMCQLRSSFVNKLVTLRVLPHSLSLSLFCTLSNTLFICPKKQMKYL